MLLLEKGAASVTCVDRFKPSINPDKNRQVCDALIRNLSSEQQARVDGLMDCFIHNKSSTDGRMIAAYVTAIEQLHHDGNKRSFDLVVSRAVLEHVYNLPEAFQETPDKRVGWCKPMLKLGKALCSKHSYDLLMTSGPPHSIHLVGLQLQKSGRIAFHFPNQ